MPSISKSVTSVNYILGLIYCLFLAMKKPVGTKKKITIVIIITNATMMKIIRPYNFAIMLFCAVTLCTIDLFADTAVILISIVSNSYYGTQGENTY